MESKKCTKCLAFKALSEFHRNKNNKDGLAYHCKECVSAYQIPWRAGNRDRRIAWDAAYYQRNKESMLDKNRQYMKENWESVKATRRKYSSEWRKTDKGKAKMREDGWARVGILSATGQGPLKSEEFDAKLEAQGGKCPICLTDKPGKRGWVADHAHINADGSGPFRFVLCRTCNTGIGHLKDDPVLLRRAADLLEATAIPDIMPQAN